MSTGNPYQANELVQAAFCSEANFSHWADARGVELEVSRILHPAPPHEHFEEIGGIFHAGNRFYLQVIEGPPESVDWYLEHCKADDRHTDVTTLSTMPIKFRRFRPGHMRFIGSHQQMHEIQKAIGARDFNPYHFNAEMIEAFVDLVKSRE